jgi:hypothetical protein
MHPTALHLFYKRKAGFCHKIQVLCLGCMIQIHDGAVRMFMRRINDCSLVSSLFLYVCVTLQLKFLRVHRFPKFTLNVLQFPLGPGRR